jgi:hypothetical protein
MTTHVSGLTVVLDDNPREDDIDDLIAAIRRMRGVADVIQIESGAPFDIAKYTAKLELRREVYEALHKIFV